jgi:hypothetical protein
VKTCPVTQVTAYRETAPQRTTQRDKVLQVVRLAERALTLSEITARFNLAHGTNVPESTISGRLNELYAMHKLDTYKPRACTVSKSHRMKQTWFLAPPVPQQLPFPEAS